MKKTLCFSIQTWLQPEDFNFFNTTPSSRNGIHVWRAAVESSSYYAPKFSM
jgi:hypothetical protein